MILQRKAFSTLFGGVAMFLCFLILPLMVFTAKYIGSHDSQWIIRFALEWAATFIFAAGLFAWGMYSSLNINNDKRLVQLQLAIHDGQEMMLYWNPIGWLFLLMREAFIWMLILLLAACVLLVDEDEGDGIFD